MWYIQSGKKAKGKICGTYKQFRKGIKQKMLFTLYRPESAMMNKGLKIQRTDLGSAFVCKYETRKMGARHVKM